MKVLITGVAGFIGSAVAEKLVGNGDTVVGIDNINTYYDIRLKYDRLNALGIEKEKAEEWAHPVVSNKWPLFSFIRLDITDKN